MKTKVVRLNQFLCIGILLCFCFMPNFLKSQNILWCYNSYYDGYWGENEYQNPDYPSYKLIMNTTSITIYKSNLHPSNFFLKINLPTNFPSLKNIPKIKNESVDEHIYEGTVEYYVREDYPTIKDILKKYNRPEFNKDDGKAGLPVAKRIEKCGIRCSKSKVAGDYLVWYDILFIGQIGWRLCVVQK